MRVTNKAWWTLAICSGAVFLTALDSSIVSLALPQMGKDFDQSGSSSISWVITAYNLGLASVLLISGRLADLRGRRLLFVLGVGVFGLGSLMTGLAPSLGFLIGARVLQALGGSMLTPASLALVLSEFPSEHRAMALGIWGAMGGVAAAIGPTVGALLMEFAGWRWMFFINVPVILTMLYFSRSLDESRDESALSSFDAVSAPLVALATGLTTLVIVQWHSWGIGDARIQLSLLVSIVLSPFIVYRSLHHDEPLLDLRLFRINSFAIGNISGGFFAIAFFSWLFFLPTFVTNVWDYSALQAGFGIAPGPLSAAVAAPLAGFWAGRYGQRWFIAAGGLAGAAGVLWLMITTESEPNYLGVMLPSTILVGLGVGMIIPQVVSISMQDILPTQFAQAGAIRQTVFQLIIAIGVAMSVAIRESIPDDLLVAFQKSWWLSVAAFMGVILTTARGSWWTSSQTACDAGEVTETMSRSAD